MCNYFDGKEVKEDVRYAVFDDIPFDKLIAWKGWLGCQHTLTFTDKYMPKRTITWGKPSIVLVNPDMDYRRHPMYTCDVADFFRANVVVVNLVMGQSFIPQ